MINITCEESENKFDPSELVFFDLLSSFYNMDEC